MTTAEIEYAISDFRRQLHDLIGSQVRLLYRHPDAIPGRRDEIWNNVDMLLGIWARLDLAEKAITTLVADVGFVTFAFQRPELKLDESNIMTPIPAIPAPGTT